MNNVSIKIALMPTRDILIKKVFLGQVYLGTLDQAGAGIFSTTRTSIFRKCHGFGIHELLINESEIKFQTISIFYSGHFFLTTRQKFVEHGIPYRFDEGIKLFLPVDEFENSTTPNLFKP